MPHRPSAGQYFLPGLIVICSVIFLDQYSKWFVVENMLRTGTTGPAPTFTSWLMTFKKTGFPVFEPETFKTIAVTPYLNLVMVWNRGISFGLLDTHSSMMPMILIAVSLLISLLMGLWLVLATQKTTSLALGLIIGGALANMADRIRFDAVADFIDVHLGERHWPAFNAADSCIVLGAAILILKSMLTKGKTNEV